MYPRCMEEQRDSSGSDGSVSLSMNLNYLEEAWDSRQCQSHNTYLNNRVPKRLTQ